MPDLRVIVGLPDPEIKRRRAEDRLRVPIRELASNVMRVVRGAGRPDDLLEQMQRVIDVSAEYREAVGMWPDGGLFAEMLHLDDEYRDSDSGLERAVHPVCRSVLQICASRLVKQDMQLRTAESELRTKMLDTVRDHDERLRVRNKRSKRPRRKRGEVIL